MARCLAEDVATDLLGSSQGLADPPGQTSSSPSPLANWKKAREMVHFAARRSIEDDQPLVGAAEDAELRSYLSPIFSAHRGLGGAEDSLVSHIPCKRI